MRELRKLDIHVGAVDGHAMLVPSTGMPVARDVGGFDWCCPACCAVLISGALIEDQFLDLLIRCYRCRQIAATRRRPPGRPLAGKPVVIPAGQAVLSDSVDAKGVMAIGPQAWEGYVAETGYGIELALGFELTPAGLRGASEHLTALLGDRYEQLARADSRGLASETPPARRQRVIEMIRYAEQAAVDLERANGVARIELDGDLFAEMASLISMLRRWQRHPAYNALVETLASPTEVQHTTMLLTIASYLVDAGNGVGIVFGESTGRIADLWMEPALLERLNLEVKTPQRLRGPLSANLEDDEALKIIERELKDAASAKHGQLNPDQSAVLAIGGFHLGPGALDVLERAATRVLTHQACQSRKPHLAALMVSEVTYEQIPIIDLQGDSIGASMTPLVETRLARHPAYTGRSQIR